MELTTLYFFCNRPTVAAMMALGTDLGDAFKDPAAPEQQQPEVRQLESAPSLSESEADFQGGFSGQLGPALTSLLLLRPTLSLRVAMHSGTPGAA